jgi:hypothetical protein
VHLFRSPQSTGHLRGTSALAWESGRPYWRLVDVETVASGRSLKKGVGTHVVKGFRCALEGVLVGYRSWNST